MLFTGLEINACKLAKNDMSEQKYQLSNLRVRIIHVSQTFGKNQLVEKIFPENFASGLKVNYEPVIIKNLNLISV